MSLLAIMGSGETAPPMARTHREVLARVGGGPAVVLDTPFGFQENADDLVARAQAYFADTVGQAVGLASWRAAEIPLAERERTLASLAQARWAFAGPGSPTYALRQWRGTPVPGALADIVGRGGALVLGSAAAVTVGSHAVPVYEIYKVGADPAWAEGLDLLGGLVGVAAAVVPHWDNAEGGTHDTRYCYLGERRLRALEAQLPEEVGVLGVDEHTALLLDVAAGRGEVRGVGTVTVRRRERAWRLGSGEVIGVEELAAALGGRGEVTAAPPTPGPAAPGAAEQAQQPSLAAETDRARAAFDTALARGDADEAVTAVLALEDALHAWRSDPLQSDQADRARRELRAMVVRLGDLAREGARDPSEAVAPYVEALLGLRAEARAAGDYPTADAIRARLEAAGVQVRDTREGHEWRLRDGAGSPSGTQRAGPPAQ